jgi:(5-formylfuran-3-yl)methyl phosphate synthase
MVMAQLLVSVRSLDEAHSALLGGAGLIDMKEPSRGSLGRVSPEIMQDIVDFVAGRATLSAAMGELLENDERPRVRGLSYAKWGLAGCSRVKDWRRRLKAFAQQLQVGTPGCELVVVAYADWQQAGAPTPEQICEVACSSGFHAFLIDTWRKDNKTLLDWLPVSKVADLVNDCRSAGVATALAGRLGAREIGLLHASMPDWFAVRSAVCRKGLRERAVEQSAVRELAEMLKHLSGLLPGAKVDGAYA